jgi:hypothetical protein
VIDMHIGGTPVDVGACCPEVRGVLRDCKTPTSQRGPCLKKLRSDCRLKSWGTVRLFQYFVFAKTRRNMTETRKHKKYALIGTGGRSSFFYTAIATTYKETSVVVALCDTNQTRLDFANSQLESLGHNHRPHAQHLHRARTRTRLQRCNREAHDH